MISKKERDQNRRKILKLLGQIGRPGMDSLVEWLDSSDYFTAPASTMFHGNYAGGLAAHSYAVYEEFSHKVDHYHLCVPEESRSLAGLLHDGCKIGFYKPNHLASGNISSSKPYKCEDIFPMGHGEKSVILAQRHIELTDQEALIIRWHMGDADPAWPDYVDKVNKQFPEVALFHDADKEVSLIYQL